MGETSQPPAGPSTLEARVEVMKREIDALQIEVMKDQGPWYKQVPVLVPLLVSVIALVFSFTTTYVAEQRIEQEEQHETRVELRELIQRLTVLPKENFQLNRKYEKDAQSLAFLGALINTENLVLGTQAAELISRVPTEVTASEYYAVAFALTQSGQTSASEALLDRGIEEARANPTNDVPGFLALLRQRAQVFYTLNRPEQGRRALGEALDVINRYTRGNPYLFANSQVQTEDLWAFHELAADNCDEARRHIESATEHLPRTTLTTLRTQVRTRAEAIDKECGSPGGAN